MQTECYRQTRFFPFCFCFPRFVAKWKYNEAAQCDVNAFACDVFCEEVLRGSLRIIVWSCKLIGFLEVGHDFGR